MLIMKDKCEVCRGSRGGELGNENLIGGVIICDYCHATLSKFSELVIEKSGVEKLQEVNQQNLDYACKVVQWKKERDV